MGLKPLSIWIFLTGMLLGGASVALLLLFSFWGGFFDVAIAVGAKFTISSSDCSFPWPPLLVISANSAGKPDLWLSWQTRGSCRQIVVECHFPVQAVKDPGSATALRISKARATSSNWAPNRQVHRCLVPHPGSLWSLSMQAVAGTTLRAYRPEAASVQRPLRVASQDPKALLQTFELPVQAHKSKKDINGTRTSRAAAALLLGDTQNEPEVLTKLLAQAGSMAEQRGWSVEFLGHLGDLVLHSSFPWEWDEGVLQPLASAMATLPSPKDLPIVPIVSVRGNHDVDDDNGAAYEANFGAAGSGVRYFAFDAFGGAVRVFALDSSFEDPQQLLWFEEELKLASSDSGGLTARGKHLVVMTHIGPYVEYWDPSTWNSPEGNEKAWGDFLQKDFAPLFERFGVSVVISGHSHLYLRGFRGGVAYATLGGGGAGLEKGEENRVEEFLQRDRRVLHFLHHYAYMSLTEEECPGLRLEAFAFATNEVLDSLVIPCRNP